MLAQSYIPYVSDPEVCPEYRNTSSSLDRSLIELVDALTLLASHSPPSKEIWHQVNVNVTIIFN